MKQKFLAAALACAMLFTLLPAAAWAENEPPTPAESAAQAQPEEAGPDTTGQLPGTQEAAAQQPGGDDPAASPQPLQGGEAAPAQNQGTAPTAPQNNGTEEPLLKFEGPHLYAKGVPVTIDKSGEGISVTYMNAAQQKETITYAGTDAVIFGGGKDEEHFDKASITLNSGTVDTIYGGGRGEDLSADVNEATIVVNGGTVTNCVYGGGLNRSVVNSASITVNDGTIATYALGGGAIGDTFGSQKLKPSFPDALNGTAVNRTLKASVVVNGGTVNYPMGGGQNYSYVGETRVELNGGTCSELVAGGSNGYTAKSTVTVSGGSVTGYLHTVNRGAVGEVVLNLNGGSIKDLYYGWNENDQKKADGTLKSGAIPLDQGGGLREALTVYYKGATITNKANIDKTSGIHPNAKVVEVVTNTATPDTVAPNAPDADKQAKVDEAVKKAVTDASSPAKSGSTIITTTLGNDQTAKDLLQNPAMTDPEEGFAKMVQGMPGVGNTDVTLVLSKNISAVHTDNEGKITSLVFDVAPIEVSGGNAKRLTSLPSSLAFRLPLPASWATAYATVKHTHNGKVTTREVEVKTSTSYKYILMDSRFFSPFEISPLAQLTPVSKPDQGTDNADGAPAKTAVVSLLDATPKTGASWAMPALLLAACGLLGLGVTAARRKEH